MRVGSGRQAGNETVPVLCHSQPYYGRRWDRHTTATTHGEITTPHHTTPVSSHINGMGWKATRPTVIATGISKFACPYPVRGIVNCDTYRHTEIRRYDSKRGTMGREGMGYLLFLPVVVPRYTAVLQCRSSPRALLVSVCVHAGAFLELLPTL